VSPVGRDCGTALDRDPNAIVPAVGSPDPAGWRTAAVRRPGGQGNMAAAAVGDPDAVRPRRLQAAGRALLTVHRQLAYLAIGPGGGHQLRPLGAAALVARRQRPGPGRKGALRRRRRPSRWARGTGRPHRLWWRRWRRAPRPASRRGVGPGEAIGATARPHRAYPGTAGERADAALQHPLSGTVPRPGPTCPRPQRQVTVHALQGPFP
jgi:hypothetical protein